MPEGMNTRQEVLWMPTMIPQRFDSISDAVRQLSAESGPFGVTVAPFAMSGLDTWNDDVEWVVAVPDAEKREDGNTPGTLYVLREVVIR